MKNSATTIDYICSNLDVTNVCSSGIAVDFSDHEAILTVMVIPAVEKASPVANYGRNYSKRNLKKFADLCEHVDWNSFLNNTDVDKKISAFINKIISISKTVFPLQLYKKNKVKP